MNKIKVALVLTGVLLVQPARPQTLNLAKVVAFDKQSLICLAENIYYESRGEPIQGQVAVAQVTINRFKTGRYGSSICSVVHKPFQFSWTRAQQIKTLNKHAWNTARVIAAAALSNSLPQDLVRSLYFHTHKVSPRWSKHKQVEQKIGNHVFYL